MTLSRCVLLTLCFAMLTGCQSGPMGGFAWSPFSQKDRTTYQTPKVRMKQAVAIGKQSTREDTPEQQALVVDLARRIQTEPDPLVRCSIADAVGRFNTPLATQVLRAGLQDADPMVRQQCCETIGKREDASLIGALAATAREDKDLDVRVEAVRALGRLPSPETTAALVSALESDDPAMQYAGMVAVKKTTGQDFGGDVRAYLAFAKGETPSITQDDSAVASRWGRWLPF